MSTEVLEMLRRCPGLENARLPEMWGEGPLVTPAGGSVRRLLDGNTVVEYRLRVETGDDPAQAAMWLMRECPGVSRVTAPVMKAGKHGITWEFECTVRSSASVGAAE